MRKILTPLVVPVFATGLYAAADRPNVLMISVDDMNDWVGCLEGCPGKIHTPNIDRLAQRGMLFTNAHCDAPVCNPSRTSILTGRRPTTTGIYNNGQWWRPHLPDVVTIPQHFRAAGYQAFGGGKVFHHTAGFNPPDQWDDYFLQVFDGPQPYPTWPLPPKSQRFTWPQDFPLNGIENVRLGLKPPESYQEFDWGPFDQPDLEMGDGQMVQWAVQLLTEPHEQPFFIAAGVFRPHQPWYVPRKYFDMYPLDEVVLPLAPADDLDDIPEPGRKIAAYRGADWTLLADLGKREEAVQAYMASITFADAMVGRIVDALDRSPFADNTIIVLWSDHGWHLGEKQHMHKFTLWEECTRVPLIIVAPGVTQPGQRCAEPVNLVDIYPTLVELCSQASRPGLDGISLVPQLRDPQSQRPRPAMTTYRRNQTALRSRRWRLIQYEDGSQELYDHDNDPNEWTNLAGQPQYAEVIAQLQTYLPREPAPDAPMKADYNFDLATYTWQVKSP